MTKREWVDSLRDLDVEHWWRQYGENHQATFYPELKKMRNMMFKEIQKRGMVIEPYSPVRILTRPRGYGVDNPLDCGFEEVRPKVYYDHERECCFHENGMLYGWSCGDLIPGTVRQLP